MLGHSNVYFLSQKLTLNSHMLLCNTFPGTMSEKGGMVGGVNCKSGMIYGKFVLLQNAYLSAHLSLAEVVVYGTREGKAADMSSDGGGGTKVGRAFSITWGFLIFLVFFALYYVFL